MTWTRWLTGSLLGLAAVSYGYGCGTSEPTGGAPPAGTTRPPNVGPCGPDGLTQSCDVQTGQRGGYVDCYHGTQTCHGGIWGPCGGTGTLSTHAAVLSSNAKA